MSHSNKLDFLHIVFTNILSHAPSATLRKLETVGLQKMNFSITQKQGFDMEQSKLVFRTFDSNGKYIKKRTNCN